MKRRGFLAAAGATVAGGFAGCLSTGSGAGDPAGAPAGSDDGAQTSSPTRTAPFAHPGTLERSFATNGTYPADDEPANGIPPAFPEPPSPPNADGSSFRTLDVNGESVRLAPIDVVDAWYRRGDARFVDARGLDQYVNAHVYGAVLSTAQPNSVGGGIDEWPTDDRVVTYCGCPHHLSSVRAAGLQKAGFEDVYAIDEGFGEWDDRGYPMAGTTFRDGVRSDVSEWTLDGRVDARHAGEFAWASVDRQYEAAPIRDDGGFAIELRFSSVTADTPVRVSTPAFTVTRPLGDLSAGSITGA